MRLSEVMRVLRSVADERLAEPWDKVGLQLGEADWQVRRSLLCIDLTPAVLAEAVAAGAGLIVAYHPPMFSPLASLTDADWKGRLLLECARRKIAIYSPHTALDAAPDGVNDWLASGLGEGEISPIMPAKTQAGDGGCKLVTFVPVDHADRVRQALAVAGAGWIGNYSQCSFGSLGTGTFQGEAGANPTVGQAGRLERVQELRMEMICPTDRLAEVVAALRQNHPYEEPAYDIYQRLDPVAAPPGAGQGRRLALRRAVSLRTLADRLRKHLGVKALEIGVGRGRAAGKAEIRTVALCAGAGGSVLEQVVDADAYVTGEMRHHDVLAAVERGCSVLLAGHTQTERPYLKVYRRRLGRLTGSAVQWRVSRADLPASVMG